MKPTTSKNFAKGKGPATKPPKKRPRIEVEDSMVVDEEQDIEDHVSVISSCDSNSSWELDPEQTIIIEEPPEEVVEDYHLPAELIPHPEGEVHVPDPNSEDEDDHTGVWREGDLESLVLTLNHNRARLKGKFFGSAGGKERRDKAWRDVADYVNSRCSVKWTVPQCKGKARRFGLQVKTKFNTLKREIFKTGGGEIDDDVYLTKIEEAMLDYVGVEGVVGLPGMHGTSIKPHQGRSHRHKLNEAARLAWDPKRESRRSYLTLPKDKVKLQKKRKN